MINTRTMQPLLLEAPCLANGLALVVRAGFTVAGRASETCKETEASRGLLIETVHLCCSLAGVNGIEQCPFLFHLLFSLDACGVLKEQLREKGGGGVYVAGGGINVCRVRERWFGEGE